MDTSPVPEQSKAGRDPKRRTVQVEYVAPKSSTTRGEGLSPIASPSLDAAGAGVTGAGKSRTRTGREGPEVIQDSRRPPQSYQAPAADSRRGSSSKDMAPPERPPKDYRTVSESSRAYDQTTPNRPQTGGSITTPGHTRLPSRGNSYSQPLAPTVATTNAQGRVTQPNSDTKRYKISAPIPQTEPYSQAETIGRPSTQPYSPPTLSTRKEPPKGGHKRSNTLGNFFRTGSISGPRSQPQSPGDVQKEKKYPPTSMKAPITNETPRQSTDSRRPSFVFGRKSSELKKKSSDLSKQEKPRRFSLLPASFSFKSFASTGNGKDQGEFGSQSNVTPARPNTRPQTIAYSRPPENMIATNYDGSRDRGTQQSTDRNRYGSPRVQDLPPPPPPKFNQGQTYMGSPPDSEVSLQRRQHQPVYPPGFGSEAYDEEAGRPTTQQSKNPRGPGVLQKTNRKFADAYDQDQEGGGVHHAGTSGAAKRVMDFFRRRGRARAEERA